MNKAQRRRKGRSHLPAFLLFLRFLIVCFVDILSLFPEVLNLTSVCRYYQHLNQIQTHTHDYGRLSKWKPKWLQ